MRHFRRFTFAAVLFLAAVTVPGQTRDTVRILGVGNSWTRDSMRWLSAIARSAGVPVIVGHAYLGGSTLQDQYRGIDDPDATYRHGKEDQLIHSRYQYWKYAGTDNPVKTPSSGYRNGHGGIGVTLERVVRDEPWDYMVFQPEALFGANYTLYMGQVDTTFDINRLVDRIKRMMAPSVASRVRTGLMVPFSYPKGNLDHRPSFNKWYNDGVVPATQEEYDALYEKQQRLIQRAVPLVGAYMGDRCSFIINVGLAIYQARRNPVLNKSGYLLQRSQANTHLSEGIAMYIASLCYAYELLGIPRGAVRFCPPSSADSFLTGDRGETLRVPYKNTAFVADQARRVAWHAQMCTPLILTDNE